MLMLDTDVIIDVQRKHPNAVAWFFGLTELPLLPGLVMMELIQDAPDKRHVEQVQKLVRPLPLVWTTETDNHQALNWFMQFHLSHGLGLLDSLIGSCAVGRDAEFCTFNEKHYRVIPNLRTLQPYIR